MIFEDNQRGDLYKLATMLPLWHFSHCFCFLGSALVNVFFYINFGKVNGCKIDHPSSFFLSLLTLLDILKQRTTDVDIKKYFLRCLEEVRIS